jgi:molecular chaperone HscA
MAAGAARIAVTFSVDADGLLSVSARERTTGIEAAITVKPSYGLTDAEIARMLQDSFAHAADDMDARALAEAQVEADRILAATDAALAADADLLSREELDVIQAAAQAVRDARSAGNRAQLTAAVEALNRSTEDFAARRMDRSVARALSGKRVDALVREGP